MWKSAENMWLTQITKTTCVYGNLDVREWLTHFTETNPYKENGGRFDPQNCFFKLHVMGY